MQVVLTIPNFVRPAQKLRKPTAGLVCLHPLAYTGRVTFES